MMNLVLVRKAAKATTVCLVLLSVAACGVKSAPAAPPDSVYPRQYPAIGEKTIIGTPSKAETRDDTGAVTQPGSGASRPPLGYLLEYPNSPSYK